MQKLLVNFVCQQEAKGFEWSLTVLTLTTKRNEKSMGWNNYTLVETLGVEDNLMLLFEASWEISWWSSDKISFYEISGTFKMKIFHLWLITLVWYNVGIRWASLTSYFTDILKRFKTMMQIFIEVCSINGISRKLKIAKCENEFKVLVRYDGAS